MKNVKCVIGANFGDEGKGLMTDYFAAKDKNSIVVLHNGGAQRGHTVITPEGYRHVFHCFSAGTYAGAATYYGEKFIVNPVLFRREWDELAKHNVYPTVIINPKCLLTTIFDMLINQVIEADRGSAKHGSCGVGIFETLYRNQMNVDFKDPFFCKPLTMTVGEFASLSLFDKISFVDFVRRFYVEKRFNNFKLHKISPTFLKVLSSETAIINFIDDFNFMMNHARFGDYSEIEKYNTVIFESGQGLLLDKDNDAYFPHLTPSNTGIKNPTEILAKLGYTGTVEACYVSRTYMTRHGVGRFDTECPKDRINAAMLDLTNVPNPFQDNLRYGMLNRAELEARVLKDANTNNMSHCLIVPQIALTHINEYGGDNTPLKFVKYFSNGMTRENIWEK